MAYSQALIDAVKQVAARWSIDQAALMAVVEIECGGQPYEADGRTPRFLFERHIFYKQLSGAKLQRAVDAGLAIPKWSRTTQYRDQGNSAGRQAVLQQARAIDPEAANKSCSWGVGQIMGFNATSLGYLSATDMVSKLTAGGVDAQIDCMVRFIRSKGLIDKLNAQDWPAFAASFNGAAYRQNAYDTRMAAAYGRWTATWRTPGLAALDAEKDVPLDRPPVQNAEPRNPWTTPEGVATGVGAATGAGTAISGAKSDGPLGYALAFVIVAAFCIAAFFFIKRMRANP